MPGTIALLLPHAETAYVFVPNCSGECRTYDLSMEPDRRRQWVKYAFVVGLVIIGWLAIVATILAMFWR